MYSKFQIAFKYLLYYAGASSGKGHGTHSPFVYEFITKVLDDQRPNIAYDKVKSLRKELEKNKTILEIEDMGAGSVTGKGKHRSIGSIARNAAKSTSLGQLLFRIAAYYHPAKMVELGTSLGISGAFLALGNPGGILDTLEGSPEIAREARKNFENLGLKNVRVVEGNFDSTLAPVLAAAKHIDLAFIDGNHQQEPTERYFRQMLEHIDNDSILIFDDIHWSREMENAWNTIRQSDSVRCSIDLFHLGIVFFRSQFFEKQHFVVRF